MWLSCKRPTEAVNKQKEFNVPLNTLSETIFFPANLLTDIDKINTRQVITTRAQILTINSTINL